MKLLSLSWETVIRNNWHNLLETLNHSSKVHFMSISVCDPKCEPHQYENSRCTGPQNRICRGNSWHSHECWHPPACLLANILQTNALIDHLAYIALFYLNLLTCLIFAIFFLKLTFSVIKNRYIYTYIFACKFLEFFPLNNSSSINFLLHIYNNNLPCNPRHFSFTEKK